MDGNQLRHLVARPVVAALLLMFSLTDAALAQSPEQQTTQRVPDDYYRAEFVILERIVDPESINEHMADRAVEPTEATEGVLWSVAPGGSVESTQSLVPGSEMYLNAAAQRLERSGRYRVLAKAGWYEAFPPDYQGKPLRVELGDWLENAGTREIEGTITVDRKRYLHVGVHLNHWQEVQADPQTVAPAQPEEPTPQQPGQLDSPAQTDVAAMATGITAASTEKPLELLTWIRETRRMRSEEIHFLDSPTIGVLVFFKKISE
ncbi:MAG: 5'-methylthioadenosine phosphorylase [Gammaproteobacteria bacterium]|nr:CsiV family protein [Marinobacter nitratireducens]TNE74880.1 MAG: 5'-methylthioadenosine phosphorylase [Gammaproteobacteria bacterium]